MLMWQQLLESLNGEELERLWQRVVEERERRSRQEDFGALTPEEEAMARVDRSFIEAIKAYRNRTGCSLLQAKIRCEAYREAVRRSEVVR